MTTNQNRGKGLAGVFTVVGILLFTAAVFALLVLMPARNGNSGPPPAGDGAAITFGRPQLIMFEEEGCVWCQRFKEGIMPAYPKTEEGKRAPLRLVDIHAPRPRGLEHIKGIRVSPTFVLLDAKGREVGRIEGYPGDEFFWIHLEELLRKLDETEG